jgi:hypothetical protein
LSDQPNQGKQIQDLMAIYFENYTGVIAPARAQMAGQLAQILKETTYEKIAPLVKQVAIDGQTVTRGTLIFAAKNSMPKPATKIPERFQAGDLENANAVPMPDYVRESLRKGLFKSPEAD